MTQTEASGEPRPATGAASHAAPRLRPGRDADRHTHRALRGQGRQRDAGGLHPPVRAALLPALGHRRGRDLGARRHRLPGRLRDRRQHRHRARHDQRAVGHPDRRGDHLRHRVPAGLLRGPLQHRPRPDHPRLRLRLLRVGADERHLRDVHLHLLRARGLDHGPGSATGARHPAVARLRGVHPDGDPAGHLRDEGAGQAAGLDHPAVADPVRHPDGVPADQPPGLGGDVLRLPGRGRRRRTQLRRDDAGRRRLPVADGADRRADRLPAVHAAADRREPQVLVARGHPGRAGLGDLRRHQAGRRAVRRGVHHRQADPGVGRHRERAGAPVPDGLRAVPAGMGGHDPGGVPGGDQPDQDQRHQRLLGLAGLDEQLHPGHQALPGPAGLRDLQRVRRAAADGTEHVQRAEHRSSASTPTAPWPGWSPSPPTS